MKVITRVEEMVALRYSDRGFVATMGALHEGHLSLVHQSKAECEETVLSIFVNPLQFGPNEDLSKYPRPLELDLQLAESNGVDIAFVPSVEDMYRDSRTIVQVGGLRDIYEGAIRPGHFDGVATVVTKLFNIIAPKVAYFGLKDLQQCAVIRNLVADLCMPLSLAFIETIRERDGLALSSRNRYLSEADRKLAPALFSTLNKAANRIAEEKRLEESLTVILAESAADLTALGFTVDYLDAVDTSTFERLSADVRNARLIAAARLGNTRLIDNIPIPIHGT